MTRSVPAVDGPGLGESRRRLLERVKRAGECTLGELEAGFGLNPETLRVHLDALVAQGLVERSGVRRSGPGRPRVLYRLTARGEALFPRREGELLRELASFLQSEGHGDVLEDFFAARLARRRRELLPRVAGRTGPARLGAVAAILAEEGFLAEIVAGGDGPQLRLCHCPLRELVAVSDLPCRFELALLRALLGAPPRREAFIPEGSPACAYRVPARATGAGAGTGRRGRRRPVRPSGQSK